MILPTKIAPSLPIAHLLRLVHGRQLQHGVQQGQLQLRSTGKEGPHELLRGISPGESIKESVWKWSIPILWPSKNMGNMLLKYQVSGVPEVPHFSNKPKWFFRAPDPHTVKVSLANHCSYLHMDLGTRGNGNHLSRQRIVQDLAEKHMSQEGVGQHRVAIGIDLQVGGPAPGLRASTLDPHQEPLNRKNNTHLVMGQYPVSQNHHGCSGCFLCF